MPDPARASYQIEPMSAADYTDVIDLWRSTEGIGLDNSDTAPAFESYLARNPGLSLVARQGTKLAGAVLCGHDGRRGYLYHLAVARQHRRNGLGRRLVQGCLDRLAELGIQKCNIFLFDDNANGELFWTKNGWVKRGNLSLLQKALVPSELVRSG